ncbi:MAG: hypothetical protein ACOYMN_18960 [Roseimicrobium sp.]
MATHVENDQQANAYTIADTSLFPPGRITITLDASYDAFARRHGAGACEVRISLPDGTTFDTPASIAIIDGSDPVAARPHIMLYQSPQIAALPEGSSCTVLAR